MFRLQTNLVQFVVNLSLNKRNSCEEVLVIDTIVSNDDSGFIYLDELTDIEKAMIDAEVTDDLKLRLLSILFAFNSTANQIKRASALVSCFFQQSQIFDRRDLPQAGCIYSIFYTNVLSLQPWIWF